MRAAPQIEDGEQREHAEDGDAADPVQRDGVEFAPVAAGRLLEHVGLGVGDACRGPGSRLSCCSSCCSLTALPFGLTEVGCWRGRRRRHRDDERERERAGDEADLREKLRHGILSLMNPQFLVNRRRALARRRDRSGRDRLAIGGLPAPGAGAVAALDHALLVDLRDDRRRRRRAATWSSTSRRRAAACLRRGGWRRISRTRPCVPSASGPPAQ